MTRRRKVLLAISATAVVVLGVIGWRVLPLFTGPALPEGATRLHVATEAPNLTFACHAAMLSSARVATSNEDLILVSVDSGNTLPVVWPAGFAAWRVDGRAVLADAWGSIVGRDGDVLDSLGGGLGADDVFHVCPFGIVTER